MSKESERELREGLSVMGTYFPIAQASIRGVMPSDVMPKFMFYDSSRMPMSSMY